MKKILVTGGTGFIGSHTTVELQQKGYQVVIVDNLSNSSADVIDNITKITGQKPIFGKVDVSNKEQLFDFLKQNQGIESIIHFAASKAVGESVQVPLKYYRNNINGLINILEAMKEFKISNLVFSSSCTVYGQPEKLPVTEQSPIQPALSPYGNTKQINEEIIRDFVKVNPEIHAIALRYFNPVGAHPSSLIGELPLGVPANLIPYITQTAAGIRECLSVFGNDYDTPDGTPIRDYIDIIDLANAHIAAIKRMEDNKQKQSLEFFNIGTGNGLSVLELIKAFEEATGVKLNYKIVGRREGDIEKVWADTSFANKELGWKAVVPLKETMLNAWNWQKKVSGIK
ncbi:MAG: UDP-glucose 4-epimerase GalE [Bacteroidales bacterium]|jgi:UDP-glucose 4-epimerase|nr:UDP-glucose 4-epimerase GalE [Bacteroidales bacterium]MBQ5404012.1 UDP-glucose 4-epimerase GalE [Bacteroidales bacterium]MBR6278364.1 UDP-glucose 4-epimerase GalE [Bacteroidales bacterium]